MNKSPIEWTDFTINPFRFRNLETGKVGHHCEKISPGCKNCFSAKMQTGPYLSGLDFIAENKPKGEFFLDENALQQVLRRKKPCRIFWCDMTDMFLEDYPDEWIDRCFAVMALTPHLTHQVLTKREKRLREYFADLGRVGESTAGYVFDLWMQVIAPALRTGGPHKVPIPRFPLPNVHLGVSVEDQQRADERIPLLLQTPAAVRFLSVEPLLGPVDLKFPTGASGPLSFPFDFDCWAGPRREEWFQMQARATYMTQCGIVDWVIVGGESGPDARPCDVAWIRAIKDQCQAAGVPVFVKQLGSRSGFQRKDGWRDTELRDPKGGDMAEWPADLRVRELASNTEVAAGVWSARSRDYMRTL
jgi:protein gp37